MPAEEDEERGRSDGLTGPATASSTIDRVKNSGLADDGRPEGRARRAAARLFTMVEDAVYIGLGLLLAGTALVLLGSAMLLFVRSAAGTALDESIIVLLDRFLLVLLVLELLYTVQVSFREHALVPQPFLLIGLIATVRRVIVLTAELPRFAESKPNILNAMLLELALLTAMTLVLVVSLVLLRRTPTASLSAARD